MIKREIGAVLISILVIILAAIVQHKSRYFAGLLSVMPLKVVAVMWIVWVASHDNKATADVSYGMISGVLGTILFLIICSVMLRIGYGFYESVGVGFVFWILIALMPKLYDLFS